MICDNYEEILWGIFGEEFATFSPREAVIAKRVVSHFIPDAIPPENRLLQACKYAVMQEGMTWEEVMLTRSRLKPLVEIRYCIFSALFSLTKMSQNRGAKMLGGMFNRCTILYGIDKVEEWKKYDILFKDKYERITNNVKDYLKDE